MKTLQAITGYRRILKPILDFSRGRQAELYLVGGILRDLLLAREKGSLDFDFSIKSGAIAFGRALAHRLHSCLVVLDEEHGACRLVGKSKGRTCTFDITDFRGPTLRDDLLLRDFTVNTLALRLEDVFGRGIDLDGSVIDVCGARKDLAARRIRKVYQRVFDDDPLRILRAYSLAGTLGFAIEAKTSALAGRKAKLLSRVSAERIRDELFKVLDCPAASRAIEAMDRLGILTVVIPEIEAMRGLRQGPYHHLDVWRHSLQTLRQLELFIASRKRNRGIRDYLDERISAERTRRALMKFAAILHDVGKPATLRKKNGKTSFHGHERVGADICEVVARRLRLSNDERLALYRMVFWHLRPGYLADNQEITPRALFRYFRDTAQESLAVLMLSVADQRSTLGPLTSYKERIHHEQVALKLIREHFSRLKKKPVRRIITGDDLIREFGLEPSKLIGRILAEIEELQAIGKVSSRKEALAIAERMIP